MENLLANIQQQITLHTPPNSTFLLAVSGGVDSVVLAHIFHQLQVSFAIAHVNYHLRGAESNADAALVRQLAKKLDVAFFEKSVAQTPTSDASIQDWARNVRYHFFEEIKASFPFNYVVLAQHQNDQVEQFFLKALRPSGAFSLGGMQTLVGNRFRPLLHVSKQEIYAFAKDQNLNWREDQSNTDPKKYNRNWWRNIGLPFLKNRFADIEKRIVSVQQTLQQAKTVQDELLHFFESNTVIPLPHGIQKLDLNNFKTLFNSDAVLFAWLEKKGFTQSQVRNIFSLAPSSESKQFTSTRKFEIEVKNDILYLFSPENINRQPVEIQDIDTLKKLDIVASITEVTQENNLPKLAQNSFLLPVNSQTFPLKIRASTEQDFMQPFGMNGKKKKIFEILKEKGLPNCIRKTIFVWECNSGILYLEGLRSAEKTRWNDKNIAHYIVEIY